MEKEALVKIIIQDINELETLLNTFTGKSEIPKVFIQLSRNKAKGIVEEIDLLENLIDTNGNSEIQNQISVSSLQKNEKEKPVITETVVNEHNTIKKENVPIIIQKETELTKLEEPETLDFETKEILADKFQQIDSTPEKSVVKPEAKNKKSEPITLGEKLMQGNQSFYDTLSQKKETASEQMFQNRPVKDIMTAIGINDRFYFQKELFNGDEKLFKSTVSTLNSLNDMESAEKLFDDNFEWDNNNEAVQLFKGVVKRRYL
jgi:hypothetical protein